MLGSVQVLDNLLQVRYSGIKMKSISVNVGWGGEGGYDDIQGYSQRMRLQWRA